MKSLIASVILASIVLFALYKDYGKCMAKGGTLVKGVAWYECVGEKK